MASRGRRTRSRHMPYDLNDYRNWSAEQLCNRLSQAGITVDVSVKVPTLIKLYRDNVANRQCAADTDSTLGEHSPLHVVANVADTPSGTLQSTNNSSTATPPTAAVTTAEAGTSATITATAATTATTTAATSPDVMTPILQLVSSQQQLLATMQQQIASLVKDKSGDNQQSAGNLTSAYALLNQQSQSTSHVPATTGITDHTINLFGSDTGFNVWKTNTGPNGVPSNLLPHMDSVSPSLQKAIREGKNINLRSLLLDGYELETVKSESEKSKIDRKLSQPLSLSEFITAFSKFKACMVAAFPQRQRELDLYQNIIIRIHTQFPNTPAFYDYHKMFAARAEEALHRNIKVDWSFMDQDIYSLVTAGRQGRTCRQCGSMTHATPDCTTTRPFDGSFRRDDNNFRRDGPRGKSVDWRGRPRVYTGGREICNNFNDKGCTRRQCPMLHACGKCFNSNHTSAACTATTPKPKTDNKSD